MGKSRQQKLEDRVGWLGKMCLVAIVASVVSGLVVMVKQMPDVEFDVQPALIVDMGNGAEALKKVKRDVEKYEAEVEAAANGPKTAGECMALMEQGYTVEQINDMLGPDDRWMPPPHKKDPVSDALAIASLKDYAGLEAERMAKMAAALMGMGGDYEAECKAVYNAATSRIEVWYVITWFRIELEKSEVTAERTIRVTAGRDKIERAWSGNSWGECIKQMLAWKQGGE